MPTDPTIQALTIAQAAHRLSTSWYVVRRMIRDGRLAAIRLGADGVSGQWRIPADAIDRLLCHSQRLPDEAALSRADDEYREQTQALLRHASSQRSRASKRGPSQTCPRQLVSNAYNLTYVACVWSKAL